MVTMVCDPIGATEFDKALTIHSLSGPGSGTVGRRLKEHVEGALGNDDGGSRTS